MTKPFKGLFIFSLICFFAFQSCNKNSARPKTWAIVNNLPVRMNVAVYKTNQDYLYSTNPVFQGILNPNDSISMSKMTMSGITYFLDCYSDDFMYHNWCMIEKMGNNVIRNMYSFTTDSGAFYLNGIRHDSARLVFLKGNNSQTIWKSSQP